MPVDVDLGGRRIIKKLASVVLWTGRNTQHARVW
eukprot:COSAG06_NODE_56607_length_284_cov_0.340541_1_plen_33_part_01